MFQFIDEGLLSQHKWFNNQLVLVQSEKNNKTYASFNHNQSMSFTVCIYYILTSPAKDLYSNIKSLHMWIWPYKIST